MHSPGYFSRLRFKNIINTKVVTSLKRQLQHVAHNTLFKPGDVDWCGDVGYASGLRDFARAKSLKPDA